MNVTVFPGPLRGRVQAPPSKSACHRLLLGAGLARGTSRIGNVSYSQDILATLDVLEALGAKIEKEKDRVRVTGIAGRIPSGGRIHCRESGSTLRFGIPLCLLSQGVFELTGTQRLMERPLNVYESLCREQGLLWDKAGNTLRVQGALKGGTFTVPGDVSSQFITGLLFALPLCPQDSRIQITPPLESESYILMTLQTLAVFGIRIHRPDRLTLEISGGQRYLAAEATVEGDHSNGAFLHALALLGHRVEVGGLDENSVQGDRVFRQYFEALKKGAPTLSLADCPDLGPVLMALAAALNGATLTDTRRLRIKESDRGAAMAQELKKMGVSLQVEENCIRIPATGLKPPAVPLSSHNDHRIAMSLALLLTLVGGTIENAGAVNKSYPHFFTDLQSLNLKCEIYEANQRT